MEEIYKNIIFLISSCTNLSEVCQLFYKDPSDVNGEKIVGITEECDKNMLKVKEEIVKMVRKAEEENAVLAIETQNGYLIKEKDNEHI